ncbi:hypothetical protein AVEN_138456-1 [Araneus ventricosus]|uniref:Uncharacterized protein n=1 Tax=Araneus ventricosus TaxID=182803 RepID=A0A4Y2CD50_ARAVE|nr:hypothetical protein AVEN_138456-1 [Araneus ventricosus]
MHSLFAHYIEDFSTLKFCKCKVARPLGSCLLCLFNNSVLLGLIPEATSENMGCYRTVPQILTAIDFCIRTINRPGTALGILRLSHRWKQVVHNAGDCIEGCSKF